MTQFKRLVQLLRSDTVMIRADALKNEVMERFRVCKLQMINFFSSLDSKLSFTTDIWTAPNDLSFMSITVHWISPDFVVQSLLMDFIELKSGHTGVNIEKYFPQSLLFHGVFDKKLAITLDNASNNDVFISKLIERDPTFSKASQIRCFGHILNLSSQYALTLVKGEISGIKKYLKAIIHSPKKLLQLHDNFEALGVSNFVKPILDVATRWNSTVDMIARAIRIKKCLCLTMESIFHESNARRRRNEQGIRKF